MDIKAEKLELIKILLETDDWTLIRQLRQLAISHSEKTDMWDEMPDEIRESVERGLHQSEAGEGIPHEQAVKRLVKWH